ncbi:MAG: type IV secretory system conjugative DNA transfer family protein [Paracoccaceae bacterium]
MGPLAPTKLAIGVLSVTLVALAMGYVIASAVLTFRDVGFQADIDFFYIAQNYRSLRLYRPEDFRLINLIMGGAGVAGLLMSLAMSGSALTRFGLTHWQTGREMKRNGFFGAPGTGFIIGKLGKPGARAPFLSSTVFPHALIVAPTGRGKTTGFVIPNLLTWQGSAVVLDVKGECYEATSRHRAAQGDKVFRFAPTDWEGQRTHRYNPLLRIFGLENPARQQMELQLLATLFLQNDNDRVQGLLKGGIDLFVAAGLLAFQRRRPTLGEIYRISASGGNKQKEYLARAHEVDNRAAKLIFTRLASTNNDTLTSYVSLLMTSGLDQWQNPAIDEATSVSDFDFRTIRKTPFSVYLVVQPLMVKPLAPLIRLFFSDLLSALQDKDPGPDEPWPVMIMLDEFNRLGKMPIVAESIEVLRHYRGHLAVVTQTIPALDEIYGENTRRALQGNAGVKLYLTPSDEKTIEELSKAVGKTTKTVVTRSRSIGKNPFEGRSQSTRTEETALLPEDEARRLPLDEIVVVVDAQMPIRAKRVVYYDDPFFKEIHAAQKGEMPFPRGPTPEPDGNVPLSAQAMPMAPRTRGMTEGQEKDPQPERDRDASSGDARPREGASQRAEILAADGRQLEMDLTGRADLKVQNPTERDVAEVEGALDDLDKLEGEIAAGMEELDRRTGMKAGVM